MPGFPLVFHHSNVTGETPMNTPHSPDWDQLSESLYSPDTGIQQEEVIENLGKLLREIILWI